ncbi:hypothetical protein K493DRAFT_296338 [Basidiobolus meristosporus CBS 931.73]|uniref:DNA-binding protein RAP1 n=1 Tax=Basidiobolus meristosporus CBS 931.73 TaxID=1314790 RepID=A0A1Y1Z670_9FUNG|nr:hypothetical protein K493DRAFT_296338 [Basidiobolus meristosporus CBS 931.73]|eukprot:ORY05778.1 hypothetical protein K493DRAFT_296338 [Basidiobolus meristosporus CBS 931.73]
MTKQVKNIFQKNGKPMSFYVPAGVKKGELVELITKHGGKVVRDEKAADVVLWEKTFHNDTGSQIFSKNFIYDSVKSGKLQENLKYAIKQTPRKPKALKKGRTTFTSSDDRVLLDLVSKNPDSAHGNKIYKELEAKNRRHTWQSWRDRYIKFLAPNQRKSLGPSASNGASDATAFKKRRISQPESDSDSDSNQPLTQAQDYQDVNEEGEEEMEEGEGEEQIGVGEQEASDEEVDDEISIKIKSEPANDSDAKGRSEPLEVQGTPTVRVSMIESYVIEDSDEEDVDQSILYEEVTEHTQADTDMVDEINLSNVTSEKEDIDFRSSQEESIPAFESYEEITQQTQEEISDEPESQMVSENQLLTQESEYHESELESQSLSSSKIREPSGGAMEKSNIKDHDEMRGMEIELQIEEDDADMASIEEDGDVESQEIQPLTQKFNDTLDESMEDLSQAQSEALAESFESQVDDNGNDDEEEGVDDGAADRLTQLEQAEQDPDSRNAETNIQTEDHVNELDPSIVNVTNPSSENLEASNDSTADHASFGEKLEPVRQQIRASSTPITRNRSQTPVSHKQKSSGRVARARSNTPALSNHQDSKATVTKAVGKPPIIPRKPNTADNTVTDNIPMTTAIHDDHEQGDDQGDAFHTYRTLYLRMIKGLCAATNSTPEAAIKAIKSTSGNFADAHQILLHGEKECSDICWTAAEDQILLDGDNSDVIQELLNRKGHKRTHLRNQFLNFYSESM